MSDSSKLTPEQATERMNEVRVEIDGVDREIISLLNRRAGLSLEVGQIKAGSRDLIFKPFREKEVMEKLAQANTGQLPEEHLRSIYREIFSSSRSLQRPQKVSYLGPEGTFSYFAGVEFLGHSVDFLPQQDLLAVFQAVSSRETELGVIPLENSLQGTVGQSLDLFLDFEVFIQSEIYCRISHSLFGTPKTLSEVTAVYSHPQPLAQCGGWLRNHLPSAKIIPTESTAAAGRRVKDEEGAVAIGHHGLANMLGLNVLASSIEDLPDNWTRFVIIGPAPALQEAQDKTSMLFTLPDKPGALVNVLTLLAQESINMKKLESRPLRGEKWKYVFFVDVECDLAHEQYTKALEELRHRCHTLRVLGSYPTGPHLDVSHGTTTPS
ncbi:MAG: prephenate dehydratase [Desulfovibrio sp.]|nr:MAG: prephenate dehydratase [Desulfovibrio sp.]